MLVGGWTDYSCEISAEAKKSFDEAMKGLVGVTYTPVAVASQLVAGMNYSFFCNTVVSDREGTKGAAIVPVFQPLEGGKAVVSGHIINI